MSLKDKIGSLAIAIFGFIANFVLVALFLWWIGRFIIQAFVSH
jgi:hypothetical protein